jgi:hypothetical protein
MSQRWEAVANRLGRHLHIALPAAQDAVLSAVNFLREVGVPLAKLLPYPYQLTLLACFFHHCQQATEEQLETLRRWFWVTSWTAAFADATSTSVRRALQEMKAFAEGDELPLDYDGLRPMPEQFNMNSGRTRAYLIWELLEFPRRLDPVAMPIDLAMLIASGDSQVFRPVFAADLLAYAVRLGGEAAKLVRADPLPTRVRVIEELRALPAPEDVPPAKRPEAAASGRSRQQRRRGSQRPGPAVPGRDGRRACVAARRTSAGRAEVHPGSIEGTGAGAIPAGAAAARTSGPRRSDPGERHGGLVGRGDRGVHPASRCGPGNQHQAG